jgi:predicted HTH transcriptional regulator
LYKPEFIVKAITFSGTEIIDSYVDSEDFSGPLSVIFQGILAFIMRNLRKIQRQKGVNTIGEPEIPQIVFEELLVNTLIHLKVSLLLRKKAAFEHWRGNEKISLRDLIEPMIEKGPL